jgi:hypothetical protein
MRQKHILFTLCAVCSMPLIAAAMTDSYDRVVDVDNVLLEVQSAANCTETFRFTNSNPYTVNIKYRTVSYASDGSSFPDSGSLYLNPGQSDTTVREYGAFTKCTVTKVSSQLSVTHQN